MARSLDAVASASTTVLADLVAVFRVLRTDIDRSAAFRLGATALLVVASGLLAGLAPLALKGMVDVSGSHALQGAASRVPAMLSAAVYLLAMCLTRLLTEFRPMLFASVEQRIFERLRDRYFAHLLNLPLSFHRDRQSGALVQALQQAIVGYQIALSNLVNSVLPVMVEVVTVTLVLLSMGEPMLVTTFAASALGYLAVLRVRGSAVGHTAHGVAEAGIASNGMLTDSLLNVETVKCFGAEETTRVRFATTNRLLEKRWSMFQRARLGAGLACAAVFALSMGALLAVALHSVLEGRLTLGGFMLVNVYMLQMSRPLEMLGTAVRDLTQAVEFIRPLMDVLSHPDERSPTDGADSTRCPADDAMSPIAIALPVFPRPAAVGLHLQSVHFAYPGGRTALEDITLDIRAGRRVALVGASGAGKSSLVRLLLRLDRPQTGSITLGGRAIETWPLCEFRKVVTVVPQDTMLFNQTIAFNIGIGRSDATAADIERVARLAQAHAFISALPDGYETIVGERGVKLSGGERQRLAIARAILRNPQVYVLDEATSMLDTVTEAQILQNLKVLSERATIVIVAHRLSSIQDVDEIVVLGGGKVVERGHHAILLASGGAYARLWQAQQEPHVIRDRRHGQGPRPRGPVPGLRRARCRHTRSR